MAVDVWVRNPWKVIAQCVEENFFQFVWDRNLVSVWEVNPVSFMGLHAPGSNYRQMVVFDEFATELRPGDTWKKPSSVWPVWRYGQDFFELEQLLSSPVSQDELYVGEDCPWGDGVFRAIPGQEHRVIIADIPDQYTGRGKMFTRSLSELQSEYPQAMMHLHGMRSWPTLFGLNFLAGDIDIYKEANGKQVVLPVGKRVDIEGSVTHLQWITILGFLPTDLKLETNRYKYNLRSALWAAQNFQDNKKFRATSRANRLGGIDPDVKVSPDDTSTVARAYSLEKYRAREGDKFLCDLCSIQTKCKLFRSGEVCIIPGSEPATLASLFKTRNSDSIIEALGTLMATQTNRLQRGLEEEEDTGGPKGPLDPEVTKLINATFDRGVTLAKLINPKLRDGNGNTQQVAITVGNSQAAAVVAGSTPQALVATIIAQIEAQGIPREKITPEMVEMVMGGQAPVVDIPALTSGD